MTRCAELSNDNKYLITSDTEGDIWFIDWQTDTQSWVTKMEVTEKYVVTKKCAGKNLLVYDRKADVDISLDEISINYETDYERVLEDVDDVVQNV